MEATGALGRLEGWAAATVAMVAMAAAAGELAVRAAMAGRMAGMEETMEAAGVREALGAPVGVLAGTAVLLVVKVVGGLPEGRAGAEARTGAVAAAVGEGALGGAREATARASRKCGRATRPAGEAQP